MKQYLIDTFNFNDFENRQMLKKIGLLSRQDQCIRYFSHIINSQNKWLARIKGYDQEPNLHWWEPVYSLGSLESEWSNSLMAWLMYIGDLSESALLSEITYYGQDGSIRAVTPKDIALQLNYHSIHHRAQMQWLIREQGITPDFIDYIATRYLQIQYPMEQ